MLIGIAAVIFMVIIAGMYKFNYLANQPGYDVDGNKIKETHRPEVLLHFAKGYYAEEDKKEEVLIDNSGIVALNKSQKMWGNLNTIKI